MFLTGIPFMAAMEAATLLLHTSCIGAPRALIEFLPDSQA